MPSQQFGAWHTLTVAHDGEEEDGTPLLDYDLAHPDTCPPAETPAEPQVWPAPRCHLDHIIQESSGDPDEYGVPTEPGSYRLRAWATPGHWCGSYYSDPEDGIEIDETPEENHRA